MKFTAVLALVAAATFVSAETNADRFARGLSPKVPNRFKRGTPAFAARRSSPSGTSSCNTGPIHCCSSTGKVGSDDMVDKLLAELGISAAAGILAGVNCSPLSVVGASGSTCESDPVCCDNNKFNGLINLGCSPVHIGL